MDFITLAMLALAVLTVLAAITARNIPIPRPPVLLPAQPGVGTLDYKGVRWPG
ncbi:hypothetical protein ABZ570_30175 [Micromonospora sp. NPDC007271]|uniref:hypothetical protein n=1 Tax=Micromonospora sp. NPDC007271 TaxID=3154587 RepID=UPI0033F74BD2